MVRRVETPTSLPHLRLGMDIAGTKKKIQRATRVAEETYKKMNELMERIQKLQEDLETTSQQVDTIESELAEQRVLLEALAEGQGVDVETLVSEADLPDPPEADGRDDEPDQSDEDVSRLATSRPSVTEDSD